MAIYISGVKGLPEQVQANKDDIKDLQDTTASQGSDIEGLREDLDNEIENREEVIKENTGAVEVGDTSGSYASTIILYKNSGSLDILLNAMSELELSDTGLELARGIIKSGNADKIVIDKDNHEVILTLNNNVVATFKTSGLDVEGDITTADGDISTDNGDIKTDAGNITTNTGNITSTSGSFETAFGHFKGLSVNTTIINVPDGNHEIHINCKDSSNVNHVLQFDADTLKLTIDGTEVGGKQLYQHCCLLDYSQSANGATSISFDIITDSPTPFTKASVAQYLYDKLGANKYITASGFSVDTGAPNTPRIVSEICATNSTTLGNKYLLFGSYSATTGTIMFFSSATLTDDVFPI